MSNDRADDRRKAAVGLRNIATLRSLSSGAKPRERHQIANSFARLENERARLERELSTWENCRRATAIKLGKVNEEIAAMQLTLFEPPAHHAAFRRGHDRWRTPAETQVSGSAAPQSHAMILEY